LCDGLPPVPGKIAGINEPISGGTKEPISKFGPSVPLAMAPNIEFRNEIGATREGKLDDDNSKPVPGAAVNWNGMFGMLDEGAALGKLVAGFGAGILEGDVAPEDCFGAGELVLVRLVDIGGEGATFEEAVVLGDTFEVGDFDDNCGAGAADSSCFFVAVAVCRPADNLGPAALDLPGILKIEDGVELPLSQSASVP